MLGGSLIHTERVVLTHFLSGVNGQDHSSHQKDDAMTKARIKEIIKMSNLYERIGQDIRTTDPCVMDQSDVDDLADLLLIHWER